MKKKITPKSKSRNLKVKKQAGRKPLYTEELATAFLERIATTNKGLHTIALEKGMPSVPVVLKWLNEVEGFNSRYARAREAQADFIFNEIIPISDDSSGDTKINPETGEEYFNSEFAQRSKLRVDARKWIASKLAPKKYGDSLALDHTSEGKAIKQNVIKLSDGTIIPI